MLRSCQGCVCVPAWQGVEACGREQAVFQVQCVGQSEERRGEKLPGGPTGWQMPAVGGIHRKGKLKKPW